MRLRVTSTALKRFSAEGWKNACFFSTVNAYQAATLERKNLSRRIGSRTLDASKLSPKASRSKINLSSNKRHVSPGAFPIGHMATMSRYSEISDIDPGETWEEIAFRMHGYNMKGQIKSVFRLAKAISDMGKIPPPHVYSEVLMSMARVGNGLMMPEAFVLIEEMKDNNVQLSPHTFQQLFKLLAGSRDPTHRETVLNLTKENNYTLSPLDWKNLVKSYLLSREYEMGLATLYQCKLKNIDILPRTYENICYAILSTGDVRMATNVMKMFIEDSKLAPARLWGQCLSVAAEKFDVMKISIIT